MFFSLKGTIANPEPRQPVTLLCYIYLFTSYLLDLPTAIIGTVGMDWFWKQPESCIINGWHSASYSLFYRVALYYQWTVLSLVTLALISVFLSSAQANVSVPERHHHFRRAIAPIFVTSTTDFGLGSRGNGPEPQKVLQSVAILLTQLFHNINICVSDVIVGLILLRQRYLEEEDTDDNDEIRDVMHTAEYFTSRSHEVIFNLASIAYYSQYAEAMYGVPLFMFSDILGGLRYMCCPCFSQANHSAIEALEKTMEPGCQTLLCCFPGSWLVDQTHHSDLIYKNIKGKMFKSPFAVAFDQKTNSIVIAVRGTLSTKDLLADLYIDEHQIEWTDESGNGSVVGFCHGGMYAIAMSIFKELDAQRILHLLATSDAYRDRRIICTGHSLGAGVCSLLAFILKSSAEYGSSFNKRTFAICYSSPGFLISESLVPVFKTFSTSVVLGDDFVCRINPHNTQDVKTQLYSELQACNKRKIDVITSEIINRIFQKKRRHQRQGTAENSQPLLPPKPHLPVRGSDRGSPTQIQMDDDMVYNGVKLYIPGNVLHFRKREDPQVSTNPAISAESTGMSSVSSAFLHPLINEASEFEPQWVDPFKLARRIIVSDSMLSHHLPNKVGDILRSTIRIRS